MNETIQKKKNSVLKRFWRKNRHSLMKTRFVQVFVVWLLVNYLRFVYWTNPRLKNSDDLIKTYNAYNPFIITFWHGRHIMAPFLRSRDEVVMAMFSRSADAEINAQLAKKLGLEIVRGSGGRDQTHHVNKRGAQAFLTLKNALKSGKTAAMIADISHKKAREAGRGIILLAKLSGRPIIPCVYAFSKEKILEKTWDKTAIPLPFGRSIVLVGEAFFVSRDASDILLEEKRMQLTDIMNRLTDEAYNRLAIGE
ncbi:lysophospholipid acyltransferase family protein [Bartonella bovis]|uniref:lysophospholipid acyltransferase family protein n=1 Tax=Bartonella bovis TaxID=155194 RepID=UPI000C9A408E|nr:lysophospholipid acyltransferase family protein [Bartonella bovis]